MKEIGDREGVGRLKLWGSLGYAASAVLAGSFIGGHPTNALLPLYAAILFAIGVFLFALRLGSRPEKPQGVKDLALGRILKDRRFLLFLAYIFLMQLPHRAGYTFFPLLIGKLGGDKSIVGYTSAVMFLSEATDTGRLSESFGIRAALVLTGLGTLVIGIYPQPLLDYAQRTLLK